jgi:hypothetical protein
MGNNVGFFDVDVTVWTLDRGGEVTRRHTSAETCSGTSLNGGLGIWITKYPRSILERISTSTALQ